eukprot:33258_6
MQLFPPCRGPAGRLPNSSPAFPLGMVQTLRSLRFHPRRKLSPCNLDTCYPGRVELPSSRPMLITSNPKREIQTTHDALLISLS